MRHPSAAAALLASAVIGGLGLPAAAASASAGSPEARAAWVPSCYDDEQGEQYACGPWHLIMRDGRRLTVRDTFGVRIGAKGGKVRASGAFAISGDGRTIAYERVRDHRVVVRSAAGGPVRELPGALSPSSARTKGLTLILSHTGHRILVARAGTRRVLTLATGRITELPATGDPQGFSGDGDEVYATRDLSDSTKWLYAYGLDGSVIKKSAPQFVANAFATALSPDGHTVAAVSSGTLDRKRPPRLRTYDLETGRLSEAVDLPVTADSPPFAAVWTPDGKVVVHAYSSDYGKPSVVRVLTVDPGTGEAARTDTYKVAADDPFILFPGE
ncbi:MAG: hypothetical protein HOV96_34050 [Nonomuraea sp.]|nr:hypothetical protein [Nonomuraea sp.]